MIWRISIFSGGNLFVREKSFRRRSTLSAQILLLLWSRLRLLKLQRGRSKVTYKTIR